MAEIALLKTIALCFKNRCNADESDNLSKTNTESKQCVDGNIY